MRSSSSKAWGETEEQTSIRSVPSCSMTSNLRSARRRLAARTPGSSASKSRNGWDKAIESARSAPRARTSAADHEDATKSGSKISTPSNPAAAAAASLSSSGAGRDNNPPPGPPPARGPAALDAVDPGGCRRGQLVLERAGQAHRRHRGPQPGRAPGGPRDRKDLMRRHLHAPVLDPASLPQGRGGGVPASGQRTTTRTHAATRAIRGESSRLVSRDRERAAV